MKTRTQDYINAEQHVKINHFTKKGFDITGLIHIGTNDWYEYKFYKAMGIDPIIGFEPLEEAVERFRTAEPKASIYSIALGDYDGTLGLYVASGDGQSSTSFELTDEYRQQFPGITFRERREVPIFRFDTWIQGHPEINLDKFNTLVVDAEGMELSVLVGMGEYIRAFSYLSVEMSGRPVYLGAPSSNKIIEHLDSYGFSLDSPIPDHDDAFFIRRSV